MYLTPKEIAAELNVKLRTAYTYVLQMAHVQSVKGGNIRVSRAAFEKWKREHQKEASCESSGNESDPTASPAASTGRTSKASESRRASRQRATRASGSERAKEREPIHVSQPRRPHV
jgi:hypothetical protein